MRILVTGALGHIGSRFIREVTPGLCDEMVLIDDLSTQRYGSLFGLPKDRRTRFFEEDILKADLVKHLKGIDAVIHLAAITNAEASVSMAEQVEMTNFEGTARVARACAESGCRMIFLSTTSVYGVQDGEVDEDCPPGQLKPQSPYAESKLKAEKCLGELARSAGLRFVTCRFGTIFGTSPGMRFHTAVNKFVWQACLGKPLTVWSAAKNQKRPYLDLKDAVRAFEFILKKDLFDGRVYNVVTLNTSVEKIVQTVSQFVPDVRVEYVDSKIMNQLSYVVSNRRFRDAGFEFQGDLEAGIRETVEWLGGVRRW